MTKVYLTQSGSFTASHSHDGALNEPLHAHTFTYEVTFYGPLNAEGFLLDFRTVQKELSQIVAPLQNQNLSTLFTHPTTEEIAQWLFAQTAQKLPFLRSVKLAEAPDRWITYTGEK